MQQPCGSGILLAEGYDPDTVTNLDMKPGEADRLWPRLAWFRLKLLWRDGGCLGHVGNFSFAPNGMAAGFDAAAYPNCSVAIRERHLAAQ